jgi:hypothetical protein
MNNVVVKQEEHTDCVGDIFVDGNRGGVYILTCINGLYSCINLRNGEFWSIQNTMTMATKGLRRLGPCDIQVSKKDVF